MPKFVPLPSNPQMVRKGHLFNGMIEGGHFFYGNDAKSKTVSNLPLGFPA